MEITPLIPLTLRGMFEGALTSRGRFEGRGSLGFNHLDFGI
jgi:hypothetical protein